jgi:hypothetical protein
VCPLHRHTYIATHRAQRARASIARDMPPALNLSVVEAIKSTLGLPENIVGALPIVGAANSVMGIVPEPGSTLPAMVDVLVQALGLATAAPAHTLPAPVVCMCPRQTPSRALADY